MEIEKRQPDRGRDRERQWRDRERDRGETAREVGELEHLKVQFTRIVI